ncbi:MAG: AAA family ATPase [Pseudomonadota bacterium]
MKPTPAPAPLHRATPAAGAADPLARDVAVLEKAERFVLRHGPHRVWRLARLSQRQAARLRGSPWQARALTLTLDALQSARCGHDLPPYLDEAIALRPAPGSPLARAIGFARCTVLSNEGLFDAAMAALDSLEDSAARSRPIRLAVLRQRALVTGLAGDAPRAAALSLQLLRALTGDASLAAAAWRSDVHGMLSHCAARGVAGIGTLESNARVAIRIGRHSGCLPSILSPVRNLLAALDVRRAPVAEMRDVFGAAMASVQARRLENATVASMLSNFAWLLASAGETAEAVRVGRDAWAMFERLAFPATTMTFVHQLETVFRAAHDPLMAATVHAQRQRMELRERGLRDTGQILDIPGGAEWAGRQAAERATIRREAGAALQDDPVTGLATRQQLLASLSARWPSVHGAVIAVVADVDDFHGVNDRLGHAIGDRLLGVLANRLAGLGAEGCARIGPDSLLLWDVVAPDAPDGRSAALQLAERVQATIALPMGLYAPGLRLSACIGHGAFTAPLPRAEALVLTVEAALEQARAIGPACIVEAGAVTVGPQDGPSHEPSLKHALRPLAEAWVPQRGAPLARSRHLVGYEALLDRPGSSRRDAPDSWSVPGLNDPQVDVESDDLLGGDAVWGDALVPCRFSVAIGPRLTDAALAVLRRRAQALRVLESVPGIPRVLHFDAAAGILIVSRPAGDALDARPLPAADTPAAVAHVVRLGVELAQILDGVHRAGVVHGRLSPAMLVFDPPSGTLTLLGLEDAGTPGGRDALLPFSAPEQTGRLGAAIDARADWYAFGAVLHALLAGAPPFPESEPLALLHAVLTAEPPHLAPPVPPALAAVVLKLLAKSPQQRYATAAQVLTDLRLVLAALAAGRDDAGFVPGANGHRTAPAPASGVYGRAAEQARLAALLDGVFEPGAQDAARVVAVRGYGGVGKTTLVRSLLTALVRRGGIFAAGRHDQFQPRGPFDAMTDALADIAQYWLSESPQRVATTRAALRARLGAQAVFLARLVPAFAPLLGDIEPRAGDADDGTPLSIRARRVAGGVLDVVRASGAPLLLFIDDLQWADAGALELLEALANDHSRGRVLMVAAWRDVEIDAAHPLRHAFARLRAAGTRVAAFTLDGLGPEPLAELLGDVLDAPPAALAPLALALHGKTRGNPFYALQCVRQLFESGQLQRPGEAWAWDDAAVLALPSSENLLDGLLREFARLPRDTQALAGGCACLGGDIDAALLATALDVPEPRVDELLQPLLRHGMLISVPAAAGGGALRFCHHRMQQAADALLDSHERARWHLAFARALGARVPAVDPALVGEHDLGALALLEGPKADAEERERVVERLLQGGRLALEQGDPARALRSVDGARALAAHARADAARWYRLHELRHALLCRLQRYAEADEVYADLEAGIAGEAPPAPLQLAPATLQQLGALSRRGHDPAAVILGLGTARALGLRLPPASGWAAACEAEARALRQLIATHGLERFDHLEPMADPAQAHIGAVLIATQLAASATQAEIASWARLRAVRLGFEHGWFATLPLGMLECIPMGNEPDDFALGTAIAQAGLRLFARRPSAWLAPGIHHRKALLLGHWLEPLERCGSYARQAHELAREAGQPELEAATQVTLGAVALECALNLADVTLSLRGVARGVRARGPLGGRAAYRQFVACMAGETRSAGRFDPVETGPTEHATRAYLATWQAVAATLFGDWALALRESRAAAALLDSIAGHYAGYLQRWVHALALCTALRSADAGREGLQAELAPLVDWLARRAAESPINFGHTHELVTALHAWAFGDVAAATAAFEQSIEHSLQHQRPYHHALACELAAGFHADHGAARAAAAYRADALQAYEAWGATAKARQLRGSGMAFSAPPRPPGDGGAGLDLRIVTQASQVLAQERDPAGLTRVLLEQIRLYAAADRGVLFWRDDADWLPRAGFGTDGLWVEDDAARGEDRHVPLTVYHYLTQSLSPLLLRDVQHHPRFGHDPKVRADGIRSIAGLPIHHRGQARGLLYLENRQAHTTLDPQQLDTLGLICLQFAVAYENAHANQRLEQLVARRTDELRAENLERRRAEQEAANANRAKSVFLAHMSHEIRTPMNAILGMSHLALRSGLSPQQHGYVQKVERSAESLLGLLNDILDFSKIEAGKVTMESVPFPLAEVLDHVANLIGLKATDKGLQLRFSAAPGAPARVIGDPLRLGQVLVNLANNAVKFTDRGSVEIGVEPIGRTAATARLRFSVRDTGVGMTLAQLARVFEPFEQAEASTARHRGGTGLGLAISRHLVELMNGRLWAESTAGEGSVFHLEAEFGLPAEPSDTDAGDARVDIDEIARRFGLEVHEGGAAAEAAVHVASLVGGRRAQQRDALRDHRAQLAGAHILLADDNEINQELVTELLGDAGVRVSIAEDGEAALRMLNEQPHFDGVLMDCQMPVLDGYDATRAIRREARFANLPIIALTASTMPGDLNRALAAGMNGHLSKPIDVQALFDTLARWVLPGATATAPAIDPSPAAAFVQTPDDVAGLDAAAGRAAVGGNDKLYRRLLSNFRAEQAGFMARLDSARGQLGTDAAARLAQQLATTAAGLGAQDVQRAAHALAQACAAGARDQVDPLAAALADRLDALLAALRGLD